MPSAGRDPLGGVPITGGGEGFLAARASLLLDGSGVLRNTRFGLPVRSLRGSSKLLRRAEPQLSSWHGAVAAISDVDCWRLIGGRGVVRYTRLVRPIVSLRGLELSGRASCSGSRSCAMLCVSGGAREVAGVTNDVGIAGMGGWLSGNPKNGGMISEPPFFSNKRLSRDLFLFSKRSVRLFAVWSFYSPP